MKVSIGDIFRMVDYDGESRAYSDCMIVKIVGRVVYLSRPYLLPDGTVGAESFSTYDTGFDSRFWKKIQR